MSLWPTTRSANFPTLLQSHELDVLTLRIQGRVAHLLVDPFLAIREILHLKDQDVPPMSCSSLIPTTATPLGQVEAVLTLMAPTTTRKSTLRFLKNLRRKEDIQSRRGVPRKRDLRSQRDLPRRRLVLPRLLEDGRNVYIGSWVGKGWVGVFDRFNGIFLERHVCLPRTLMYKRTCLLVRYGSLLFTTDRLVLHLLPE